MHLTLTLALYLFEVPEGTYVASQGPNMGAVSAQKALHGFETETRELLEVTKESIILPDYVPCSPGQAINYLTKIYSTNVHCFIVWTCVA